MSSSDESDDKRARAELFMVKQLARKEAICSLLRVELKLTVHSL
jgi:hypothetical protein